MEQPGCLLNLACFGNTEWEGEGRKEDNSLNQATVLPSAPSTGYLQKTSPTGSHVVLYRLNLYSVGLHVEGGSFVCVPCILPPTLDCNPLGTGDPSQSMKSHNTALKIL